MHLEVLTDNTKKVFDKISKFQNLKDAFYLAGGTALALQLGHRISVDLDFFSDEHIKKTFLSDIEDFFGQTAQVIAKSQNELTIIINEVKITFLHYPFALIYPLENKNEIILADLKEIALMKAYAIGRRQSLKDYIDLYTIVSRNLMTLGSIVENSKNKYGEVFNDRVFLEQLVYIKDIDDEPIQWIDKSVSKEEIRSFFEAEVKVYFNTLK